MTYPHVSHLHWVRIVAIWHPLGQIFGPAGCPTFGGAEAMHASLYINFPNVFAHAASSPQAKRSIHQGSLTVMSGCFMCARRKSSSISWMSGYLVCAEHLNRSGMAVRVATHLLVNRENNSPRIFCVDNLDWMSMPAWNRNVSFPYSITSVQAPSALIECEST